MSAGYEIEILDFKEDPANDCAFAVIMELRGTESADILSVYFTEEFFTGYFRIRWFKKLPQEETRIEREKKDLFIQWALMKAEDVLRNKETGPKIVIDYEKDAAWAEKVEKGILKPASERKHAHLFIYKPAGRTA